MLSHKYEFNQPTELVVLPAAGEPENVEVKEDPIKPKFEGNFVGRLVISVRSFLCKLVASNLKTIQILLILVAVVVFHVYLAAAVSHSVGKDGWEWCDGVGFLIILTSVTYWAVFYYVVLKRILGKTIEKLILGPINAALNPITAHAYFHFGFACLFVGSIGTFIVLDAEGEPKRLLSAAGIVIIISVGLIISKHPDRIKWEQVLFGVGLQLSFGLIIIKWPMGRDASMCFSNKTKTFLDFADAGSGFIYGYLSTGFNVTLSTGDNIQLPPLIAFRPLSIIFFFNFVMGFLYHYGILIWVVQKVGWLLETVIGTTAAESTGAAANIFIGQSEVMLMSKAFLPQMTKSELHALMVAGLATVAGSEFGLLMSFGVSPAYLISASVMAAPASLALAKLIYPETEESKTTSDQMKFLNTRTSSSALDAASQGASEAIVLIGTIIANLLVFVASVAFVNAVLSWVGGLIGMHLSLELILGKLFIPFAYITGVDTADTEDVAVLLGLKIVANEVVAYQRLLSPEMAHLTVRSKAIASHALCSFSSFGASGSLMGVISYIIPQRRQDVMRTIWFAFLTSSFCGLLNACVAGALLTL